VCQGPESALADGRSRRPDRSFIAAVRSAADVTNLARRRRLAPNAPGSVTPRAAPQHAERAKSDRGRWIGRKVGAVPASGDKSDEQIRVWHVMESAGINRHGEGDENALHRRLSESRWPRVMRWCSVRAQRSVDRGCAGWVIEPRNDNEDRGADVLITGGRQYCWWRFRELLVGPARSESLGTYDELHAREPGDLVVARWVLMMPRPTGSRGGRSTLGRAARGTLRR
jgi:hypothetical protein